MGASGNSRYEAANTVDQTRRLLEAINLSEMEANEFRQSIIANALVIRESIDSLNIASNSHVQNLWDLDRYNGTFYSPAGNKERFQVSVNLMRFHDQFIE